MCRRKRTRRCLLHIWNYRIIAVENGEGAFLPKILAFFNVKLISKILRLKKKSGLDKSFIKCFMTLCWIAAKKKEKIGKRLFVVSGHLPMWFMSFFRVLCNLSSDQNVREVLVDEVEGCQNKKSYTNISEKGECVLVMILGYLIYWQCLDKGKKKRQINSFCLPVFYYFPYLSIFFFAVSRWQVKVKGKPSNDRPPYFDFSVLRLKSLRMILLSSGIGAIGAYTPLFYLVIIKRKERKKTDPYFLSEKKMPFKRIENDDSNTRIC